MQQLRSICVFIGGLALSALIVGCSGAGVGTSSGTGSGGSSGGGTNTTSAYATGGANGGYVDSSGNIFVAGYEESSSLAFVPLVWKNGTATPLTLTGGNADGLAHCVAEDSGGTVYAAGYEFGANNTPVVWENGTPSTLSLGANYTDGYPQAISADSSSNVWIAGYEIGTSQPTLPVLWKNGTPSALGFTGANTAGGAYGLWVNAAGSSHIVVGAEEPTSTSSSTTPVYWQNGTSATALSLSGSSYTDGAAYGVTEDSSGNIYIAGSENGSSTIVPVYWENGSPTALPLSSGDRNGVANGVAIDGGGNVYVVGYEGYYYASTDWVPVYWKNGGAPQKLPLTSSSYAYGPARSISIGSSASTVLIVGVESGASVKNHPLYWENAAAHLLPFTQ